MNKVRNSSMEFVQHNGREPTFEELGKLTDIAPERVEEILGMMQGPVSLETPIGEDSTSLGDLYEDPNAPAPIDAASIELLKEQMSEVLDTLNEREGEMIRLRYGLRDGRPRTLEELGQIYGISRERVRQIESRAMRKLRKSGQSQKLRDFMT